MKAIMYHYVRQANPSLAHFRYLDVGNFERQLDYFQSEYGFVTREEWDAFISGHSVELPDGVVLTFDDAMSCHFDYVYPILKERGLWGIFYVPTAPYESNAILDVHRIHLLTGAIKGAELYGYLKDIVSQDMIPFSKREDFEQATYVTQTNYPGVAEFKRLLNYYVDEALKPELISKIAERFDYTFPTNFYVSAENLNTMSKTGMIIGSHTQDHPVMSKLNEADQRKQLVHSFDYLESICHLPHRTFCHPFGGFHSFDENTVKLLDELNVLYSFNVWSRDIEHADLIKYRHALPRYDCNEFPHGAAS